MKTLNMKRVLSFALALMLVASCAVPLTTVKSHALVLAQPTIKEIVCQDPTTLSLSWSSVSSAKNYEIWRATSKTGKYSCVGATTETKYSNKNCKTGTTYYYKVRAVTKDNIKRPFSPIKSGKTKVFAPTIFAKQVSSSSINIAWGKLTAVDGYVIYRSTSSNGKYKAITTTTNDYYLDKGLSKGKTYYYKAKAYTLVDGKKVYSSYSKIKAGKTAASSKVVFTLDKNLKAYKTIKDKDGNPEYYKVSKSTISPDTMRNTNVTLNDSRLISWKYNYESTRNILNCGLFTIVYDSVNVIVKDNDGNGAAAKLDKGIWMTASDYWMLKNGKYSNYKWNFIKCTN